MKRRLNGRLLLVLVVVASLLAGGLHLLHGSQVKRSARGLLEQARRAEAQGDDARAEDYASRYLALRPDSLEGRLLYGNILERRADTDAGRALVASMHEKTLRLDPANRELRRRLVDLDLRFERFAEARTHIEILREQAPNDGRLLELLGRCAEGEAQLAEAANHYRAALKADPSLVATYGRLADLLRTRLEEPAEADRIMDARLVKDGLIAANPKSASAYLERARYRTQYGVEAAGAAADVARALELAPDDPDTLLAASEQARLSNDASKAAAYLKRGVERAPKNLAFYLKLAANEVSAGRTEGALSWLRKGLLVNPADPMLRWTLADYLIADGKTKEAAEVIESLQKDGARLELTDYLKGRLDMAEGNRLAAVDILERAAPALTVSSATRMLGKRALILLGECYAGLGDQPKRYAAYERAVAIQIAPDPTWLTARMGLASSLVALGRVDEALAQYRIIRDTEPKVGVLMARLQIARNLSRPEADRRWEDVDSTIAALERAGFDRGQVALLRAESLAAQKRQAQSRSMLDKALTQHPDHVELWLARAAASARDESPEVGWKVLEDARRRLGDRPELRIARAAMAGQLARPRAAKELESLEREADRLPVADRQPVWRELAASYLRIGDDRQAARLLGTLSEGQPNDLAVQLALLDVAMRLGDDAGARKVLGRIEAIEGKDGALWRYGKARLLIQQVEKNRADRSPLAEARQLLNEVERLKPSWSKVPLAQGLVDDLDGNQEAAVTHYLHAILDRGERDPVAVRRAVELLNQQQRYTLATRVLREVQKQGPLSPEMEGLVATVSYLAHDYGDALRAARQTGLEKSTDYRDLLWLGQLTAAAGKPAEPVLRRAVEVGGDAPHPWVALVLYLAREGQTRAAELVLRDAERHLPEAKFPLALAQCYEAVGDTARAARMYEAALAADPRNTGVLGLLATFHVRAGRFARAEDYLRQILAVNPSESDAAWARAQLVRVKLASGNPRLALKVLAEDADSAPGRSAELPGQVRLRAQVLAVQPALARRREAIALLNGLVSRGANTDADVLLLGQLYAAEGDWPKARQQMQSLLDADGKNPTYLGNYVRLLLASDRAGETAPYIKKLEEIDPMSPVTVELKARLLRAQGRGRDAADLLKEFARRKNVRIDQVGSLLEDLGQVDEAEQLLRVNASRSKGSEGVLLLARFLGRRRKTAEALDLCERFWSDPDSETVVESTLLVLSGAPDDRAQQARVDRWLAAALLAHPASVPLQFALANLRILERRYDDAEAILKSLHERNKTLSAPLNNLAWLLAMRHGRADEAQALVGEAIALDGETPGLLDTRALARMAAGKQDEAVRDLENAVSLRPAAEIYYHLARAYMLAGRVADAAESLKKAKALGLTLESLHPLEREGLDQLIGKLAKS